MRSQESEVLESAGSKHPDVEIGEAYGDEAGPSEDHVALVERREEAPGGVAGDAERGAGKAVEFAADDVAKGVAGKSVQSEEANVDEHDYRAEANVKTAVEVEGLDCVVPKEAEKNNRKIEKVAVNVLQDEGERSFAAIVLPDGR